jgi:transposase
LSPCHNGSLGQHRISVTNWQEARRKRALELKGQGWKQRTLAAFGVSEATVSKWVANMNTRGAEAGQSKPYGHRPRKLRERQLQMLPELLSHGAEAYGVRGQLWTCARIRVVIGEEFGVWCHKAPVSRLLKVLQWTPQMPIEHASQRDEAAIEKWRVEVWPMLNKKRGERARVLS